MACFRRHRPFTTLSRRKRRKKVLALNYLIHCERFRCGGMFYDECDLDYYHRHPDEKWGWSDIVFTGRDPAVLWNAEIITARTALHNMISNCVFDEAYQQLSDADREIEFRFETTPNYNKNGKIVSYTMVTREKPRYAAFNGLTYSDYIQQRKEALLHTAPPPVYCGYKILPGYAYGIGLSMVVDAERLSIEVIEAAIADFRARGEREWRSPEPASIII